MPTKLKAESEESVLTDSMDVNSKEFKEFQFLLREKSGSQSAKDKMAIELFSLQIKVEDYLNTEDGAIISVGDFLRDYLDRLNIKQNQLAKYIGLKPSNFSKILTGTRKVNFEQSFMLGQIFSLDPKAWMQIQIKNEYLELKKDKEKYFQTFTLEDLVKIKMIKKNKGG